MGSGLILLVIVGAWLAVLVPMFLRSHDNTVSMTSVDRFSDAMRVLSRRDAPGRRIVMTRPPMDVRGPSLAERRRRTLVGLLAASLLTLVGGVFVSGALLAVNVVVDGLLGAFVVHCRRQALLRAERAQHAAARRAIAARATAPAPSPVPVPASVPVPVARAVPSPQPVAAARYEDPQPRSAPAAALGEAWSPIPVPVPTYVNAPVAGRRPRVLDLTRPGEWSSALEGEDDAVMRDDGIDLDRILDRRRAVND